MDSRFKPIEIFDYETTERTSFKIIDPNGNEYLNLNHTEIKNISIDLKSGVVFLTGRILGAPKELELSKWKRNQKDLIKKLEFVVVRNGYARHYILNAGIQKIQEDYQSMSYFVMFKHDNRQVPLYHTAESIADNLRIDYKVHLPDINFKNVSGGTWTNLGLSTVGIAGGIVGVLTGTITIPVVISLVVGASTFSSATFDFTLELHEMPEDMKGQADFVQQFVGDIGKVLAQSMDKDEKKFEKKFEGLYSSALFIYGLMIGRTSAKTILNSKSFSKISKPFQKGYLKIKKITLKSSKNATKYEGATRAFNKELFINDLGNTIGAGQSIYDKISDR